MHAKTTIILNEIHTESFSKEKRRNKIEKLEIKVSKIEACLSNFLEINQINSKKNTLNGIENLERNELKNSDLDKRNRKKDFKAPIKDILAAT